MNSPNWWVKKCISKAQISASKSDNQTAAKELKVVERILEEILVHVDKNCITWKEITDKVETIFGCLLNPEFFWNSCCCREKFEVFVDGKDMYDGILQNRKAQLDEEDIDDEEQSRQIVYFLKNTLKNIFESTRKFSPWDNFLKLTNIHSVDIDADTGKIFLKNAENIDWETFFDTASKSHFLNWNDVNKELATFIASLLPLTCRYKCDVCSDVCANEEDLQAELLNSSQTSDLQDSTVGQAIEKSRKLYPTLDWFLSLLSENVCKSDTDTMDTETESEAKEDTSKREAFTKAAQCLFQENSVHSSADDPTFMTMMFHILNMCVDIFDFMCSVDDQFSNSCLILNDFPVISCRSLTVVHFDDDDNGFSYVPFKDCFNLWIYSLLPNLTAVTHYSKRLKAFAKVYYAADFCCRERRVVAEAEFNFYDKTKYVAIHGESRGRQHCLCLLSVAFEDFKQQTTSDCTDAVSRKVAIQIFKQIMNSRPTSRSDSMWKEFVSSLKSWIPIGLNENKIFADVLSVMQEMGQFLVLVDDEEEDDVDEEGENARGQYVELSEFHFGDVSKGDFELDRSKTTNQCVFGSHVPAKIFQDFFTFNNESCSWSGFSCLSGFSFSIVWTLISIAISRTVCANFPEGLLISLQSNDNEHKQKILADRLDRLYSPFVARLPDLNYVLWFNLEMWRMLSEGFTSADTKGTLLGNFKDVLLDAKTFCQNLEFFILSDNVLVNANKETFLFRFVQTNGGELFENVSPKDLLNKDCHRCFVTKSKDWVSAKSQSDYDDDDDVLTYVEGHRVLRKRKDIQQWANLCLNGEEQPKEGENIFVDCTAIDNNVLYIQQRTFLRKCCMFQRFLVKWMFFYSKNCGNIPVVCLLKKFNLIAKFAELFADHSKIAELFVHHTKPMEIS